MWCGFSAICVGSKPFKAHPKDKRDAYQSAAVVSVQHQVLRVSRSALPLPHVLLCCFAECRGVGRSSQRNYVCAERAKQTRVLPSRARGVYVVSTACCATPSLMRLSGNLCGAVMVFRKHKYTLTCSPAADVISFNV